MNGKDGLDQTQFNDAKGKHGQGDTLSGRESRPTPRSSTFVELLPDWRLPVLTLQIGILFGSTFFLEPLAVPVPPFAARFTDAEPEFCRAAFPKPERSFLNRR